MRGFRKLKGKAGRKALSSRISNPGGTGLHFSACHDIYAVSGGRVVLTDCLVSVDVLLTTDAGPDPSCHLEPEQTQQGALPPLSSLGPAHSTVPMDDTGPFVAFEASSLPPQDVSDRDASPPPSIWSDPVLLPAPTDAPAATAEDRRRPPSKSKHNAGERLKQWEPHFPRLLAGMLRVEAHPLIPGGDCQSCHAPQAAVACCNEYLVRTDLVDLDYVRWLGHQGAPCPERLRGREPPLAFVVVHTNGIHRCKIQPCLIDQALNAYLFPGTIDLPQTLFTHAVLRDAHIDILTSKKPPHAYIKKLERKTRHATSAKSKNWYREFNVAFGIWRHLQMCKRSGMCHGVKYPNRREDLITVPCFACPWPGVNLPEDWENTSRDLQYIYRIFMGADGNHSLHKKSKRDDKTDYSLAGSRAFFADAEKMAAFAKKTSKDRTVVQTCNLAMCGAFESTYKLLEHLLSYYVGCTYLVGLMNRWDKWNLPLEMRKVLACMKILLPQMHMLAHKESCTGHSNGETVEIAWAILYEIGVATREMNGGARHDAICDSINGYNWDKMQGLAEYLAHKLGEKLLLQLDQAVDFAGLTYVAGPDLIYEWAEQDINEEAFTPADYKRRVEGRGATFRSVYVLDKSKAREVPSEGQAYEALMESARSVTSTNADKAVSKAGGKVTLKDRVEAFYCVRRGQGASDETTQGLRSARATLWECIVKFREQQERCMPALDEALVVEEVDGDDEDPDADNGEDNDTYGLPKEGPEVEILALPSDLGEDTFKRSKCLELAFGEMQIRVGLAYNLIAALKQAIGHVTTTIPKSLKLINPTTDLGANHHVVVPKKTDNPGGFNLQANRNLGDHKVVGSWIFHVTPPDGEDEQEEWEQEDYASPGATAYARKKSDMFKIMSEECRRLVQTAHDKHYTVMAQDETRQDAFEVTQKQIHLLDNRLNNSLVCYRAPSPHWPDDVLGVAVSLNWALPDAHWPPIPKSAQAASWVK
ncbi:hypothetical protein BD311DRAFT_743616 [Dichomitus squalens]|uniref:CxC2-like cysteine cluster KDZ transposase-associated domain-containing protein n=1 Tax=Dichomitus squalens TaxID=114155 RepID=A0A4Q9M3R2_9APHY|nr:hypothetical protein BD311DRAFT_743616 [Dichomitus squalens]